MTLFIRNIFFIKTNKSSLIFLRDSVFVCTYVFKFYQFTTIIYIKLIIYNLFKFNKPNFSHSFFYTFDNIVFRILKWLNSDISTKLSSLGLAVILYTLYIPTIPNICPVFWNWLTIQDNILNCGGPYVKTIHVINNIKTIVNDNRYFKTNQRFTTS